MKKITVKIISIISIITLLIVVPFVPGIASDASIPSSTADQMIRVHLSSYGTPTSISMNATGKHTIADNNKELSGAFTVKVVSGKINILSGSTTYVLDADVLISAADLTPTHLIKINSGYSYAGDIRILVKNGTLKIVNHVDYDTYVVGVIPYEMSNSWPLEALKAQAVAARSYAYYVSNSRNRTTQEHDIVNTTASQVYNGYNASYANCITAVRETANQILQTNSGGNVYACYAASNGGFTEYPVTSGVASSNLAYLPGNVKDDYDLTYALSHTGYSAKITVPKTLGLANLQSSSEQPYKMIRESLTASGINVASITADVPVKSIVLTNPKYSNPNRIYTGADITVTINDDITRDVVLSYAPIIDGTTTRPFVNGILNLSNKSQFKILVVRDNGADWTLASTRYGHGSGLSQVGCYQMAQSGKKYTDMLTFYYLTGTQTKLITKNWPNVGSTVDPVTPTQPTIQTGIVNITSGKLTVRSGPGTTYTALGYLTKAQAVQITGTSGDWYQINYNNASAYVSKQYIKLTSTPATNIGWVKSGSTWKYYASSGSALTGWQKISGTWYYLNTSTGIMASGWQKISGKWYYLGSAESGAMQSGWQKISGNWYYLSGAESGVMQSGWQKISGNWYYLSGAESGVMQSGWQKIAGNWYYLSGAESGVMLTGWQYISGKWYYFATGDSGRMLTGTQKIGGTTYKFNSSGAWIS